MTTLHKKRDQIIDQLKDLTRLRKGQISEQYFEKTGADGKMKRFGPYYVWQASVNGKKRSIRMGKDQIEQVQKEVKGYKEFKKLCGDLATVTEQITLEHQQPHAKKNAMPRKKPSRKK